MCVAWAGRLPRWEAVVADIGWPAVVVFTGLRPCDWPPPRTTQLSRGGRCRSFPLMASLTATATATPNQHNIRKQNYLFLAVVNNMSTKKQRYKAQRARPCPCPCPSLGPRPQSLLPMSALVDWCSSVSTMLLGQGQKHRVSQEGTAQHNTVAAREERRGKEREWELTRAW